MAGRRIPYEEDTVPRYLAAESAGEHSRVGGGELINAIVIGRSPKNSASGDRFDESAEAIGFATMSHRDYIAMSIT